MKQTLKQELTELLSDYARSSAEKTAAEAERKAIFERITAIVEANKEEIPLPLTLGNSKITKLNQTKVLHGELSGDELNLLLLKCPEVLKFGISVSKAKGLIGNKEFKAVFDTAGIEMVTEEVLKIETLK